MAPLLTPPGARPSVDQTPAHRHEGLGMRLSTCFCLTLWPPRLLPDGMTLRRTCSNRRRRVMQARASCVSKWRCDRQSGRPRARSPAGLQDAGGRNPHRSAGTEAAQARKTRTRRAQKNWLGSCGGWAASDDRGGQGDGRGLLLSACLPQRRRILADIVAKPITRRFSHRSLNSPLGLGRLLP